MPSWNGFLNNSNKKQKISHDLPAKSVPDSICSKPAKSVPQSICAGCPTVDSSISSGSGSGSSNNKRGKARSMVTPWEQVMTAFVYKNTQLHHQVNELMVANMQQQQQQIVVKVEQQPEATVAEDPRQEDLPNLPDVDVNCGNITVRSNNKDVEIRNVPIDSHTVVHRSHLSRVQSEAESLRKVMRQSTGRKCYIGTSLGRRLYGASCILGPQISFHQHELSIALSHGAFMADSGIKVNLLKIPKLAPSAWSLKEYVKDMATETTFLAYEEIVNDAA